MTLPKTFSEGEVLTAADLNGGLENLDARAPWPCTSTTRPAHAAGRIISETDTGRVLVSTGGAWRHVGASTDWTEAEWYGTGYAAKTQGARCHVKLLAGDVVALELYMRPDSGGTIAAGETAAMARVATTYRPSVIRYLAGGRWVSGASPVSELGDVMFTVGTDGNVKAHVPATSTALRLSGLYRL